jgi:hypothetical protein
VDADGQGGGKDVAPAQARAAIADGQDHAYRHRKRARERDVLGVVEGVAVERRRQGQHQDGQHATPGAGQVPAHEQGGDESGQPEEDVHDVARLVGVERRNAGRGLGQAFEEGPVHRDVFLGHGGTVGPGGGVPVQHAPGVAMLHSLVAGHAVVEDGGQHHGRDQRDEERGGGAGTRGEGHRGSSGF